MFLWNLNARAVGLSRDLRHSRQVASTVKALKYFCKNHEGQRGFFTLKSL